jgi:Ca2+-binding RTX toxin-like protein
MGGLVAMAPAGSVGETCRGVPVTGDHGTPADDVLIVRNNQSKSSGEGDDLICMVEHGGYHEIYAGPGDDRIYGSKGWDYVYPGHGDDRVKTGESQDLVSDFEDRGDDRFDGGPGLDHLRFSAMFGRLTVEPVVVDLRAGRARGHGHDRLAGFEILEGTGKRDLLLGSNRGEEIDGIRGGDKIDGRGGDDIIFGATIAYSEEGERDPYDGEDRWLRGGRGDDRIYGLLGADRLLGGPGADRLSGGGPTERQHGPGDSGNGGAGRDECTGLESASFCEAAPD